MSPGPGPGTSGHTGSDRDTTSGTTPVLALDTSALLRRYVADRDRLLVLDSMAASDTWSASALARSELQLGLVHAAPSPAARDDLWDLVRRDWEAFWEVPVDGRCLARATEIGATYGVGTTDAIHLAAADRLPRPVRFVTFERQQIPAAVELGFEVLSPYG